MVFHTKTSEAYGNIRVEPNQPCNYLNRGHKSKVNILGQYMCLWILFLYFLTSVYLPSRAMPRLQHAFPETLFKIRTSFHYRNQLEVLIWHQLDMFGTFYGVNSEAIIMWEHFLKCSLPCLVNVERSSRMKPEPLFVRCFIVALAVCGLTEVIPIFKHSVTFKRPIPCSLKIIKQCIESTCKIHRIHCSINALKISITRINEFIVISRK